MGADVQPLNVAMVGCDGYAGYLMDRLEELPADWNLVAVTTCDSDSPTVRACLAKGLAVYTGAEELMLALPPERCPVMVVPTSIESHFGYAKKMIRRGYHVLLEKPPVATVQDLDELIELQRESGKYISVNFQMLFSPLTQRLKDRISRGEFGRVLSARASASMLRSEAYFSRSAWSGKLRMDGRWVLDGTIGNPLAHLLTETLYLATASSGMAVPSDVQAELYHANEIESEDTSCLRLHTTDGVSVFFAGSLSSSGENSNLCEIETEQAVIRLFDYSRVEIVWADGCVEKDRMPEEDIHLPARVMLCSVAEALAKNEKPLITVDECRPYMLAWNGAFESFGMPVAVASDSIYVEPSEQGAVRCIQNLQTIFEEAVRTQSLFSELDVAWAVPGRRVDMTGYNRFPFGFRWRNDPLDGQIKKKQKEIA